jgi:hypothetical protein
MKLFEKYANKISMLNIGAILGIQATKTALNFCLKKDDL